MYKYNKSSNPSSTSSGSPKTPVVKKKARIIIDDFFISSQSEVQWSESPVKAPFYESPLRGSKTKSANDFNHTPVRIIKRHISSPQFNGTRGSGHLRNLGSISEDGNLKTKPKKNNNFDFDEEDFDIYDDFNIPDRSHRMPDNPPTDKNPPKHIDFEDSFDDTILNSIPLEEISKQVAANSNCNVEVFLDAKGGLSQVVTSQKPLPRHISDPLNQNESPNSVYRSKEAKKPFERHNSLPQKTIPASTLTKDPAPRLCTPEEIAEKKRLAQERLAMRNPALLTAKMQSAPKRPTTTAGSTVSQQPPIKRICTKEEIEEKRRIAMERLSQTRMKEELQKKKK